MNIAKRSTSSCTRNGPEMDPKWTRNGPEMDASLRTRQRSHCGNPVGDDVCASFQCELLRITLAAINPYYNRAQKYKGYQTGV